MDRLGGGGERVHVEPLRGLSLCEGGRILACQSAGGGRDLKWGGETRVCVWEGRQGSSTF